MAWVYSQHTGIMVSPNGNGVLGRGYSGRENGLNNPAEERHANIGPIPRGNYTIGPAFTHALAGPITMSLTPRPGTDTFGRDGFMIHGDTPLHISNPTSTTSASHGCIVIERSVRRLIADIGDLTLMVEA